MIVRKLAAVAVLVAGLLPVSQAGAVTLGMFCLTGNDAGDCAIGEARLTVDVTDAGGGLVSFLFANSGPEASSISEVYFDDGSILALSSATHSVTGITKWTQDGSAKPGNLPGGDMATPEFIATAGFVAESDPPPGKNGVNPGETLDVVFSLQGGQTFADVISELSDGTLRIGIHMIAFDSGGSEGFVNDELLPPGGVVVPVPAAVWLFGSGLLGLVGVARRKRA